MALNDENLAQAKGCLLKKKKKLVFLSLFFGLFAV